jgi:hypothetical protein
VTDWRDGNEVDRLDLDTWLIGKKVANTSQQVAVAS